MYSEEFMTYAVSLNAGVIKSLGESFGLLLGISHMEIERILSIDDDSSITIGYSYSRLLKVIVNLPYMNKENEICHKNFIFSGEFYLKVSLFTEKYYNLFYIKNIHLPSIFTYQGEVKVLIDVTENYDVLLIKNRLFDETGYNHDENSSLSQSSSSTDLFIFENESKPQNYKSAEEINNHNENEYIKSILNSHSLCLEINGSISFNLFALTKGILPSLTFKITSKLLITVNDQELGTGLFISIGTKNNESTDNNINQSIIYNFDSYRTSFEDVYKYLGLEINPLETLSLSTGMSLFINEKYIGVNFEVIGIGMECLFRISDGRLSIKLKNELFTLVKSVGKLLIYKAKELFDVGEKYFKSLVEEDYEKSLIERFLLVVKRLYQTCDEMGFIIQNKVYDYLFSSKSLPCVV